MNTLTTSQARYQTYGNQTAGTLAGAPDGRCTPSSASTDQGRPGTPWTRPPGC